MADETKPLVTLGAPSLVVPGDIEFKCPHCSALCKANSENRSLQHSLPTCAKYDEMVAALELNPDGPAQFLARAGIVATLAPEDPS